MIRPAACRDLDRLERLWFYTVVTAHPTVPRQYWEHRRPDFRRACLGSECCAVYLSGESDTADGFFTLIPGNALPWLCVSPAAAGRGAGSELMAEAKRVSKQLHTWVLQENLRARYFLQEQGFVERERQPARGGGQHWLLMCYQGKDSNSYN
jgi:GNAT superfamily N-acetyltransferase